MKNGVVIELNNGGHLMYVNEKPNTDIEVLPDTRFNDILNVYDKHVLVCKIRKEDVGIVRYLSEGQEGKEKQNDTKESY